MKLTSVLHEDTVNKLIELGFYDKDESVVELGSGSTREAYGYKNYVFKVPTNLSGVSQNQEEFHIHDQVGNANGLLTEIYDSLPMKIKFDNGSVIIDNAILVSERVEPVGENNNEDYVLLEDLYYFMKKLSQSGNYDYIKQYIPEKHNRDVFSFEIYEEVIEDIFATEYPNTSIRVDEMCLDFNMGRRENGDFVILDYGGSSVDSFSSQDHFCWFSDTDELLNEASDMTEVPDVEICG